jgi:predicted DsbA family dithiol-disulfide isomerase
LRDRKADAVATPSAVDEMAPVPILYFSDVLCVWAYVTQLRVDEVTRTHAGQVAIAHRFCSVFGDTAAKIGAGWADRGGFEGYADHVSDLIGAFPEATIDRRVWRKTRPASSMGPHLFLKAVQLAEAAGTCEAGAFEQTTWDLRRAFFRDAFDIASADVQREIAARRGLASTAIEPFLRDGRAHAALARDYKDAETMGVQGSPSFVLNEGRQKLYGNVGYRIIEANIQELLRRPDAELASWC